MNKWFRAFFVIALICVWGSALGLSAQSKKPEVRHSEIRFELAVELAKSSATTSDVIAVPLDRVEPFLAIGAAWKAQGEVQLSLRSSTDGVSWSEWSLMGEHGDYANERGEQVSALALLDQRTRFVQYRLSTEDSATISGLRLVFISPGATPREMQQ